MGERERQERFVALLKENGGILLKVAGAYTRTAADREEPCRRRRSTSGSRRRSPT